MATSLDRMMTNTFISIIFDWENIKKNKKMMDTLNMETNTLCIRLKEQNPSMRNSFIQAHVLALLMMMMTIISLPCRNINDLDHENIVLNNFIDNAPSQDHMLLSDDHMILSDDPMLLTDDPMLLTDDPMLLTNDPMLLTDDPMLLTEDN